MRNAAGIPCRGWMVSALAISDATRTSAARDRSL